MTGAQYKAAREKLELTQQQLADLLGVHKITIAKRESEALQISKEAVLAIQFLKLKRGETA